MAVAQKDRVAQGRALWQLGSVLGDQGQFKNAEVPLRDALALLESELGSDHLDIAKACNGMLPAHRRSALLSCYHLAFCCWTPAACTTAQWLQSLQIPGTGLRCHEKGSETITDKA